MVKTEIIKDVNDIIKATQLQIKKHGYRESSRITGISVAVLHKFCNKNKYDNIVLKLQIVIDIYNKLRRKEK